MYFVDKTCLEPYDLVYYYSPTVPYEFPKEKLPQNVCERELLQVYKCYRSFPKQSEDLQRAEACSTQTSVLNQCKRRRDMQIFHAIREWETEKYQSLPESLRPNYLSRLTQDLDQLKTRFEGIPATEANASLRWRMNSDILQTQWRLNYLQTQPSK